MKEDYLWDKTGNDSDIENLENALKVFRQKDTTPPVLPTKNLSINKKDSKETFNKIFSFAFATTLTTACLALVAFSLGFLQFSNTSEKELATIKPNIESPQEKIEIPPKVIDIETKNRKTNLPIQTKVKFPKKTIKPKKIKVKKRALRKIPPNKPIIKKPLRKKASTTTAIKITKEERDAYNQLMRALAITSSQFKKVSNKIKGIEEEKPVIKEKGR